MYLSLYFYILFFVFNSIFDTFNFVNQVFYYSYPVKLQYTILLIFLVSLLLLLVGAEVV